MATLLLGSPPASDHPLLQGTVTLVIVLTPIRDTDGHWHTRQESIPAGQTLAEALPALPAQQDWWHTIWNGGVVPAERRGLIMLQPGDEVWAFPTWGYGSEWLATAIVYAAISIAVSIAVTALTYLLFPPQKTQIDRPEEHTFSFGGIQTAVGPGNVVPVIYGTHRVGGQLLRASVDQALVVVSTPDSFQQVTALTTPPVLSLLVALGEGPVDNIIVDSVEVNGQPLINLIAGSEVDFRYGLPDQTPMGSFGENRNTFSDGRELPDNSDNTGHEIAYTTTAPVTAFVLNVVFNQGLFNLTQKGEKEDNTVNVSYRYRVHGTTDWTAYATVQVAAQRTAPVRVGIRVEQLSSAIYDIAINYGGPRHSDELHSKFTPTLESVTEVQDGTQSYPNTALLGLRAVATESLQGSLPNITVIVRGKKVRVGTFNQELNFSDNPAWCVMDFMTSERYGLGIPDSEIDLTAFAQWAGYNEETVDGEQRHTMNYVLDRDARAQTLLMEMMGGSRTILLKSQGLWIPRPTRNDPPVQLLSWTTCTNLKITYTRDADRVNVMEGRFANEEDGYQQDVMAWPTSENWPAEMHKASLEIRGVTKPSRIQRALQFELNRRKFENVRLEMDCSLDAVVLQVHDIFRFSHPLPGWGASGRLMEGSTQTDLYLDEDVTMVAGAAYQIYIKHVTDYTEVRPVFNPGTTTTRHLQLAVALQFQPIARDSVWAFGLSNPDTAVRLFRVTSLKRNSDTTIHLEAVVHNPSITDEPVATALPIPPGLFNPLGPPPPLTYLIATELTRVQPSGASLRVVNLAWDIAALGPGYAPYAGATIYRRTVLDNSTAGQTTAGASDYASEQNDANTNFVQLLQVTGHVLEVDDYSVVTGGTYVYRVVPISQRGIPNNIGSMDVRIHVAGPTTPDYYPGSVPNLRLRGKAVGDLVWEGRDVHVQWDQPSSALFSETFFIQDYVVQIWAPGQSYLMRSTVSSVREFVYTLEMNTEDQVRTGHGGAARDLEVWVWARTNTGRLSLDPAHIRVTNPPPDMSMIIPDTMDLAAAAIISWDQYAEPRDFDHYEVHLDTINPPVAIYEDVSIAFHGYGTNMRKVFPQGLTIGTTYYTFILPYDTFGPGIASQTTTLVPRGIDGTDIDTTPPGPPTNLVLTTGSEQSGDGTIVPWVRAQWTAPPDEDVAWYQIQVFVGSATLNNPPTTYATEAGTTSIRFNVPGAVLIRVKVLAQDGFGNASSFTAEATITSGGDTVPPQPPTNLTAISASQTIHLLWTPPPDPDYAYSYVWVATVNDFRYASIVGYGIQSFSHGGLGPNDTRVYWVQAVDTSGNLSGLHPADTAGGVVQQSGLLDTTYISSIAAEKILAGTISVLVRLGVANRIFLDGVNDNIAIYDLQTTPQLRVAMGKLGTLNNAQWGLQLFDQTGATMWNFATGATEAGISNGAVNAAKIRVGVIDATHLRADTAVITGAAQIANAIIGDAHITNLSVNKINAGNILAQWTLGVGTNGQILLSAANEAIHVIDTAGHERIRLGRMGPTGLEFGLYIWNAIGQVMWEFNSGASSLGIQDLAVTNAKIANAAITNAKIGNLEVDSAKIANLTVGTGKIAANAISSSIYNATLGGGISTSGEVQMASVTIPTLNPGDRVWLLANCTAVGAGAGGFVTWFILREDNLSGSVLHTASAETQGATSATIGRTPMSVQHVYNVGSVLSGKTFVVGAVGIGAIEDVRLVALVLQK